MTVEEYNRLLDTDDWELNVIRSYKNGKLFLDVSTVLKFLNEQLIHCNSGEYIGIGYHGGMTKEEWKIRRLYVEKCIETLRS